MNPFMGEFAMKLQLRPSDTNRPRDDLPQVMIDSLNYDGRGVARMDGKTVFIDGALPGEIVEFQFVKRHKNYDSGGLAYILKTSPDRTTPPCPHFGVCGGCDLQHLKPDAQIRAKQQILSEHLAHIGKVQPDTWLSPLTGPAFGYRRRARLGVRLVPKKGGVVVGFRARRRSYLADLTTCPVLGNKISDLLPALRDLISSLSCPNRIPQLEFASGDAHAAFVFRHLVPLDEQDKARLKAFGHGHGIQIYLQDNGLDSATALWPSSPDDLAYRLDEFDVEIRFRPTDFVQINAPVNRQMVSQAIKLLDLNGDQAVLDLFCGVGNFTLPVAKRARRSLGVEADPGLIQRARSNAILNGITNANFIAADLYRADGSAPWLDFHADRLLLDPPRSGAMAAIKRLNPPYPSRIVYVSCHPATLARDSEYLVHVLGYRLAAAGIVDMFPQTSHMESMALFVRA
jgi:23S rRNA (uracil1939-C5)-methyltransferase